MSVAVCVMPLRAYLGGTLQRIWGGGLQPPSIRRRTVEEVRGHVEAFQDQLEKLLAFRPEWDEESPARDAKIFSLDNFAGPFQYARSQAYRRRLPVLCGLEAPQVWLPVEFEPVFQVAPPWDPESRLSLASMIRVGTELDRLCEWMGEEDREDLAAPRQVAEQLRTMAALGLQHHTPVIVEG